MVLFQYIKVMEGKERGRNYHRLKALREILKLNLIWDTGLDHGIEKWAEMGKPVKYESKLQSS